MKIKDYPLVFAKDYHINTEGYVYKFNKSNIVVCYIKTGSPYLKINDKEYSLLNLIIEYFVRSDIKYTKVIFSKDKKHPLRIPLRLIKISYSSDLNSNKESLLIKYNCYQKSVTANSRASNLIDKKDVMCCLVSHDFRCRYCKNKIQANNWHLDHINPLANSGKNIKENLAPSCKTCNLMKGCMGELDFINKCKKIAIMNA